MSMLSSSFLTAMLLQTVVWPMLVVLVGISIQQIGLRRYLSQRHMPIACALTVGAGFFTGYALIYVQFVFPPLQVLDWLPPLLLVAFLVFAADDIIGFAPWLRLGVQGVFALLASSLLLWPILRQSTLVGAAFTLAVVSVLWLGLWGYLDRRSNQDTTLGVILLIVATGAAVCFAMTGSILLGQLGGALAATLGGWLLCNWSRLRCPLGHAVITVIVLPLGALLLIGHFYAETPLSISLLLLAAFAASVPMVLVKRYRPNLSALAAVALTGLIALVPIALAVGYSLFLFMAHGYGGG